MSLGRSSRGRMESSILIVSTAMVPAYDSCQPDGQNRVEKSPFIPWSDVRGLLVGAYRPIILSADVGRAKPKASLVSNSWSE